MPTLIEKLIFSHRQSLFLLLCLLVINFFESDSFGLLITPIFFLYGSGSGQGGHNCGNESNEGVFPPPVTTPSTPFLAVWENGKFKLENDFMFGKPENAFTDKYIGEDSYAKIKPTPDLYKIISRPDESENKVKLQVREIEPEESFIDQLVLQKVVYPVHGELVVDGGFKRFWVFDRTALTNSEGVDNLQVISSRGEVPPAIVTSKLEEKLTTDNFSRTETYIMNTSDYIEIMATVTDTKRQLFLLLGSNYRDWPFLLMKGYGKSVAEFGVGAQSPYQHFVRGLKASLLFLVLVPIWAVTNAFSFLFADHNDASRNEGFDSIMTAFSTPRSLADVKSLKVEFWDGMEYNFIELVHPRYYTLSFNAVPIPRSAVMEDGSVKLRVTATKKHNLSHLSLVAPSSELPYRSEAAPLLSAKHSRTGDDHATALATRHNDQFMHTVPGDVVDLEFSVPKLSASSSETFSYVLQAAGFYTSLSPEGESLAGFDWPMKLADDSKVWLHTMQSYGSDA